MKFNKKWLRELGWFGGPEGAALFAIVIAIPFLIKRVLALKNDADAFEQTRASDLFRVSIAATADAPIARAFDIIVPIDVPSIMPGYGPLPAVTSVEAQTGDWNAIGQTRTIRLADNTTAREEITDYEAPSQFGYKVSNWNGALQFMAREAKSEWRFSEVPANQTRIEWRYTFRPRSAWLLLPLMLVVQLLWRGAMKQALRECVRQTNSPRFSR